jgi:hypothetical protein
MGKSFAVSKMNFDEDIRTIQKHTRDTQLTEQIDGA